MARTSRVPTFMGSDRALARYLARPIANFLHLEVTGGLLLLAATAAALIWANSPWDTAYQELWHTEIEFTLGTFHIEDELLHVVNDGLMAIFFFVVGLEIKRELVVGELREPRSAILPAVAAIGGMVVPAAVYAVMNAGGDGSGGWGIPMATDIAFALGVVSLLGRRVPATLKIFLLSLAIVDDIGAIGVIAIFFTEELSLGWLGLAVAGIVVMYVLRRLRVWYMPVYVIVGVFVWLATFESGIHATIAGVVLGLLTPARPLQPPSETRAHLDKLEGESALAQRGPREVRATAFLIRESMSVAERLEHAIHPWTSYVIIPIFALANAGIALSGDTVSDAATSEITLGVVLGLVIGKVVGIAGFTLIAERLGLASFPAGMRASHVVGVGFIGGIGFTVSLFIAGLAFDTAAIQAEAKVGILAASALAAILGTAVLAWAGRRTSERELEEAEVEADALAS